MQWQVNRSYQLVAIVAVAALATFGSAVMMATVREPASTSAPSIGGPFVLKSQTGENIDSRGLAGKPWAIFFGYTHCPDVCPTTLFEMSELLKELGPSAKDMKMFFVTIDPARDTAELLSDYLANFDPRIQGLTGTEEEIAAVAKLFRVYFARVPGLNGDYSMNHSAIVYLMGKDGRLQSVVGYDEPRKSQLEKFRKLL